ncbi:5-formyltetrahydrofolate cyclo-ligase [Orbaceae bacterium ESL0721]|nr:5-formyltetrahydrofolate cyclo-ligase [Orbaceae bacterium ESL0721]
MHSYLKASSQKTSSPKNSPQTKIPKTNSSAKNSAVQIRNQIREKRRQLPESERQQAEQIIYQKIKAHPAVSRANRIAIFLSFDGELNTHPIINYLWQAGKSVYLPIVDPLNRKNLLFLRYTEETLLIKNRFGIQEPPFEESNLLPYQELDIIFTPLVAFDERGYRFGMGGGYYDRLLANYQDEAILPIGLAFACQKVDCLDNQPWDVKLPEIIYA